MEKKLIDLSSEELIIIIEEKETDLATEVQKVIDLAKQLADKQVELDGTVAINDELTKQIEDLTKQVPEEKPALPTSVSKETFEVEGVKYRFAFSKISTKDGVITADAVLASEDLQKELIAKGSGMIKAIGQ